MPGQVHVCADEGVGDRIEVQFGVRAAVGQHRPLRALDEHDDRAGRRIHGLQVHVHAGQERGVARDVRVAHRTDER